MVKRTTEVAIKARGRLVVESDGGSTATIRVTRETGQYGEETTLEVQLTESEINDFIELLEENKPKKKQRKVEECPKCLKEIKEEEKRKKEEEKEKEWTKKYGRHF